MSMSDITKPIVHIGASYDFAVAGDTEVSCTGLLQDTDEKDFLVDGEGYWERIYADGKWLSVNDVEVHKKQPFVAGTWQTAGGAKTSPETTHKTGSLSMSTKPVVYIDNRYRFRREGADTTGKLAGLYVNANNTPRFTVEHQGHWTMIQIDGQWLSFDEVSVKHATTSDRGELGESPCDTPTVHATNEDSESIRSAETIQSLRAENAKLREHIRWLELSVDIYETSILFTGNRESLGMVYEQICRSWKRKTGGAK